MLHLKRVLTPPAMRVRRSGGRRGAPLGNRNAFKHGRFTRERRALYADIRSYIRKTRALTDALKSLEAAQFSHAEPRRTRRPLSAIPHTILRDDAHTLRASA